MFPSAGVSESSQRYVLPRLVHSFLHKDFDAEIMWGLFLSNDFPTPLFFSHLIGE